MSLNTKVRRSNSHSSRRSSVRPIGSTRSMLSRRSQRTSRHSRTSMRATDEELSFEPPTKCYCQRCQMRFPTQQMIDERERTFKNEPAVLTAIDDQVDDVIQDLAQIVKFKSVSVEPKFLLESCLALDWVANRLANLKFKTYEHLIPDDPVNCFREPRQKVLFARYFSSPTKPTLLIYGHLDVLPAKPDCWLSDPFELVLKDGLAYGRGVTSGKGMLVGWIHAIECWLQVNEDLPINVKFIVDMLHEVGSTGLQDYVRAKSDFFLDVDYIVFDVNSWVNNDRPVIACSLTGWAYFGVEVRGANKSLESGLAGGLVFEPMIDLCHLMNSLVDDEHEILIPRIENNVRRLTTPEWHLLESATFRAYEYKEELYVRRLRHDGNKVEVLQSRWCKPSLTMHGVEGADSRPGCTRILPMKVMSKFSIRLVPDQDVEQIHCAVREYMMQIRNELNLGTSISVHLIDYMEPICWSTESKLMKALRRAVGEVYQKDPIATQGIPVCLPIANVLGKLIKKPIILMPFYKRRDRHQQENEFIEEDNLMRHTKTCASLLFELSFLRTKCKCDLINKYCNLRGVKEKLDADRGYDLPVPPKRNLLTSFFKLKQKDQPAPVRAPKRNSIKKFLCFPFHMKKSNKKRPSAAPK